MDSNRAPKPGIPESTRDTSGIALFMVIGAISVLSILVTEFTYVAQVNQKIAFDGLDQVKAHYMAKSALKLSLLRLKAYQNVKTMANNLMGGSGAGGGQTAMIKGLLDKIWSEPFFFPIITKTTPPIPGLLPSERDKIIKFQEESAFEGKFISNIESESSKFNLNMILAGFQPKPAPNPSASPSGAPSATPNTPPAGPSSNPSATPTFDPEAARQQLREFLDSLMKPKMEDDADFAAEYRDPHLIEDLVDNIAGWADRAYERRSSAGDIPMKKAPFYSVSELHMIPGMDEDLYNLFAPNLTVTRTPGINVNSIAGPTLQALFPGVTKEELVDFFKFRDDNDQDNSFKSSDEFIKYVKEHFVFYQRGNTLEKLQESFTKNHIQFVTEESEFKITVRAQVNQSTRLIEAWVTLGSENSTSSPNPNASPSPKPSGAPPAAPPGANPVTANGQPPAPDPGLKIHFMRIL